MNYFRRLIRFNFFAFQQHPFYLYIVIGVACGLAAVVFHQTIHFVYEHLVEFQREQTSWLMWSLMIISPALGGLVVGLIVACIEPTAGGSGIPQAKAAYWRDSGIFTLKALFWRFVSGVFSLGSGNSLGREGPTVHLCSAIASQFGQRFKLKTEEIRSLVPVGVAAGIAAAFNAPMAAVIFVIEEMLSYEYRPKNMAGVVFAAVIAASLGRILLDSDPIYDIPTMPEYDVDWWMLICIPIGIAAGVLGSFYLWSILAVRQYILHEQKVLPIWARPAIGGLLMGIVATLVLATTGHDGVFSFGFSDLHSALSGQIIGFTLLILLFAKMLATIFCYSFGGSGGVFAPSLFLGTMLGAFLGYLVSQWFAIDSDIIGGAALLGMGAFFAGFIRAPFTSVLIIYEMTGEYSLILPLMFGNMLAFGIAERLHSRRIYDSLLLQDGIRLSCHDDKDRGS